MERTSKSTMVELVEELEKLLADSSTTEQQRQGLRMMVDEAKAGEYHDFKNEKYACGKVASSGYLRKLGFVDLARRIIDGEFDEVADAEDLKRVRDELFANNPPEVAEKLAEVLKL